MAEFEPAVELVLKHEGGYTPGLQDDPGGATNFGISQRAYPGLDIKNLTVDEAKAIYKKDYWRFDSVTDQHLANCLLDCAVNQGPGIAAKCLGQAQELAGFQQCRMDRYQAIITIHPQDAKFLHSWTHRVYDC